MNTSVATVMPRFLMDRFDWLFNSHNTSEGESRQTSKYLSKFTTFNFYIVYLVCTCMYLCEVHMT